MELKNRSFQYGKVSLEFRTQRKTSVTVCAQSGRRLHGHARSRTRHCRTARSVMFWSKQRHSSMRRCFKWLTSRILLRQTRCWSTPGPTPHNPRDLGHGYWAVTATVRNNIDALAPLGKSDHIMLMIETTVLNSESHIKKIKL